MTKEQEKEMLTTGGVLTLTPPVRLPAGPPRVAPKILDRMAHAEVLSPNDSKAYNQMSVADAEALHELRQMDTLHQQDAAAAHYYKGIASQYEYEHGTSQEASAKRSLLVSLIQKHKQK